MRKCSGLFVLEEQWNIDQTGHVATRMEVHTIHVLHEENQLMLTIFLGYIMPNDEVKNTRFFS